jgi:cyclohexanecarboxylate-CoA ligase
MTFETTLTQDRIDEYTPAGFWTDRMITDFLGGVALVAMPDPRLQERACACVILNPGVEAFTFEEMQGFLRDKGVAKQYWPEHLEVLGEFPKTPSGKIRKFELREQVAGGA